MGKAAAAWAAFCMFSATLAAPVPSSADPVAAFYRGKTIRLVVGFSAAVICMGLVFAVWLIAAGVGILLVGLVGWLYEYYRRDFAQ